MKPSHLPGFFLILSFIFSNYSYSQCGIDVGKGDTLVCGEQVQLGVRADWLQVSSGTSQDLKGVFFANANTGYACGNSGTLLKTTNGGSSFQSLSVPVSANLNALFFISPDTGIAVGNGGVILRTFNGGTNGSQPSSGTTEDLNAIFYFNSQIVYAGGTNGTLLKSVDGGATWNSSSNGISTMQTVLSIHFPETQIGYAGVGNDMYKSTDGGGSWSKLTTSQPVTFKSVLFLNRDTGFVCMSGGSNFVLRTYDGGQNWKDVKTEPYLQLNSIVKDANGHLMVFGGGVWTSKDLGENWTYLNTAPVADFNNYTALFSGGSSVNSLNGIAVGRSGMIYRNRQFDSVSWYPTAGLSDSTSSNPWANPNASTSYMVTAYMGACSTSAYVTLVVDDLKLNPIENYILACGDSVQLDARANISNSATGVNYLWSPNRYLNNTTIVNPTSAILESTIYQIVVNTNNGCTDTARVYVGLDFHMALEPELDINCGSRVVLEPDTLQWARLHTGVQVSFNDIQFLNDQVGYIATMSSIIKTLDGGKTWSTNLTSIQYNVHALYFRNTQLGFASARSNSQMRDVILKTTNGGSSWTVFDPGVNYDIRDIFFISDQVGFALANPDKILKTVNGGLNWLPVNSAHTGYLYSLYFPNATVGYAVGNDGLVLKTTDAGANWTNIAQLKQYIILKGVNFVTADTGFVTGDRYVWKTTNGGASWIRSEIDYRRTLEYTGTAITFSDAKKGLITSYYRHNPGSPTFMGALFATVDGGDTWKMLDIDSTSILSGVYSDPTGMAFACGDNGSLFKRRKAPQTYAWSPATGLSDPAIRNPYIEPTTNTLYALTATSGNCVVKDSVQINVMPLVIDAGPDQQLVCGDSIRIEPRTIFMHIEAFSTTYSWVITNASNDTVMIGEFMQLLNGYFSLPSGDYKLIIRNDQAVNPMPLNVSIIPLHGKAISFSREEVSDSLIIRTFTVPDYSNYSFTWQPMAGRIGPDFVAKNYRMEIITPQGCKTSDSLYIAPVALTLDAGSDKFIGCGMSVQFDSIISNHGTLVPAIQWSNPTFLDNPGSRAPIASPITTTRYVASITTGNGCFAYDSVWVVVDPLTVMVNDLNVFCKDTARFAVLSNYGGVLPLEYLWSPGIGIDSVNSSSPSVVGLQNRAFNLRVRTWNGCEVNDSVYVFMKNPPAPSLCLVGVNEFDKNELIWNKGTGRLSTSFDILKETNVTGQYQNIGVLDTGSNYVFSDTNSFPFIQSNRYKITYVDECGLRSMESDHHQTMHLTINKGIGSTWNLIWNSYEGFPVSTYNVYRGTTITNLQQIGTSSGSNNSYSDLNAPDGDIFYQVELISPNNCNPTGKNYNSSRSNKASNKLIGLEDPSTQNGILLYPNPASGSLTVTDLQGEYSGATLRVVSMLGQTIFSGSFNEEKNTHSLDISTIQPGAYILILEKNGQIWREIFVKK